MSYIGMRHLVAAPVTSYTPGSAITYGTGFVAGPAYAADLTYVVNDNPDHGDDVEVNNDNGVNGYNGTVDATDMEENVKADMLGWEKIGTTDVEYEATDQEAPKMGWGFIRVRKKPYTKAPVFEAKWFHMAQFTQQTISASTKKRQIEWNHPRLNVNGIGAYLDNTGKVRWFRQKTFDTEAAAKAWLNGKANISASTT